MVQQHVHYNHTGDEHSPAALTWFGTFQFMRVGVYFRHDFRVIRFVRVPFDHEMTFGGRFLGGFAREMIVAVARTSGLFVLCAWNRIDSLSPAGPGESGTSRARMSLWIIVFSQLRSVFGLDSVSRRWGCCALCSPRGPRLGSFWTSVFQVIMRQRLWRFAPSIRWQSSFSSRQRHLGGLRLLFRWFLESQTGPTLAIGWHKRFPLKAVFVTIILVYALISRSVLARSYLHFRSISGGATWRTFLPIFCFLFNIFGGEFLTLFHSGRLSRHPLGSFSEQCWFFTSEFANFRISEFRQSKRHSTGVETSVVAHAPLQQLHLIRTVKA